jgi:hypothetical protein
MHTSAVITFLATCAVIAQVFVATIVILYIVGQFIPVARNALNDLRVILDGQTLWLAALVAVVATCGSLYFSEVAHFPPCKMCWYQRIAMYPLAPMLVLAAWRRDRGIKPYVILQAGIGALISIYHIAIEIHPSFENSRTCNFDVPCSTEWFVRFHYLTIPRMALTGFVLIIVLMLLTRERSLDETRS